MTLAVSHHSRHVGWVAAVGRAGLYPGLVGLLGGAQLEVEDLQAFFQAWEGAFRAVPAENAPPRLHPDRFAYYQRAFKKILGSDQPQDVLWPLLRTWIESVELLPEGAPQIDEWQQAFQGLGLLGQEFSDKVAALDAYLDNVEELLDEWGQARGIERENL